MWGATTTRSNVVGEGRRIRPRVASAATPRSTRWLHRRHAFRSCLINRIRNRASAARWPSLRPACRLRRGPWRLCTGGADRPRQSRTSAFTTGTSVPEASRSKIANEGTSTTSMPAMAAVRSVSGLVVIGFPETRATTELRRHQGRACDRRMERGHRAGNCKWCCG